jgi:hypothetical protein
MSDKDHIESISQMLIKSTSDFCDKYLDEEYKNLCIKMIEKMKRKRNVPFVSGKLEIWAAAIIYSIGSVNFLFDKSFKPYATADDICNYFGTSKSTTSQKSKLIRDMFKMGYFSSEFQTARMNDSNPFSNMVMINGFIVDKRMLPEEIQDKIGIKTKKGS